MSEEEHSTASQRERPHRPVRGQVRGPERVSQWPMHPPNQTTKAQSLFIFLKYFIYLFLDRREGGEKERERNINVWLLLELPLLGTWPATQACALTGNRTGDPLVCRRMLNPLSYTNQSMFIYFLKLSF